MILDYMYIHRFNNMMVLSYVVQNGRIIINVQLKYTKFTLN